MAVEASRTPPIWLEEERKEAKSLAMVKAALNHAVPDYEDFENLVIRRMKGHQIPKVKEWPLNFCQEVTRSWLPLGPAWCHFCHHHNNSNSIPRHHPCSFQADQWWEVWQLASEAEQLALIELEAELGPQRNQSVVDSMVDDGLDDVLPEGRKMDDSQRC